MEHLALKKNTCIALLKAAKNSSFCKVWAMLSEVLGAGGFGMMK